MSAWAAVAIASYFAGSAFEASLERRSKKRISFLLTIILTLPLFYAMASLLDVKNTAYIQYFLDRFTVDDPSGSMVNKLDAWDAWTAKLGSEILRPHPLGQSFCPVCTSPQDLGTLINMIWFMGLLVSAPLLAWLAFMAVRHGGAGLLVASLPLIAAKFYFFDPSLWLYFGLLMFCRVTRSTDDVKSVRLRTGREFRIA
jgi:hypothetical protein